MASSPELAVLIGALKRAASRRERLGILFRAWKQVRKLSPEERARLALHLGVDGAVELIEEAAEGQEQLPAQPLVELLEGLKSASPASFGAFLGRLRDPEQRAALLREGLERARREWAEARPSAAPPPTPREPGPEMGPAKDAEPPPPSESPRPEPPAPPPPEPPAPPPQDEPVGSPREPRAAVPEAVAVVDAGPSKPLTHVPREAVSESLADRLAATPSIVARFRALGQGLHPTADLPLVELRPILDCFAPGWERRRALQSLLRRGAPSRVADALELIAGLESPSDRRWCLGSLLRRPTLTTEERARVMATRQAATHAPGALTTPAPAHPRGASAGPRHFVSRVPFGEARISTAAVYCSDGRLGDQVEDFLHAGLSLPRFDRVAVPGGPVCLAGRAEDLEELRGVEAQLRFLAGAHQLEHVILIAHDPCAFYAGKLGVPHDTLGREQRDDLARAAGRVRQLGPLRVSAYLASASRGRLHFEPVSV